MICQCCGQVKRSSACVRLLQNQGRTAVYTSSRNIQPSVETCPDMTVKVADTDTDWICDAQDNIMSAGYATGSRCTVS